MGVGRRRALLVLLVKESYLEGSDCQRRAAFVTTRLAERERALYFDDLLTAVADPTLELEQGGKGGKQWRVSADSDMACWITPWVKDRKDAVCTSR